MEASTTIEGMLSGNKIFVPDYQRAYSWSKDIIEDFLKDLEDYENSNSKSPYYFGHFLYEKMKEDKEFAVIDGQQRLTTIIIFLSILFGRLKELKKELSENEKIDYENVIKRGSRYTFSTVKYDDDFFKNYLIEANDNKNYSLETQSSELIKSSYDYLKKQVKSKKEEYCLNMISNIFKAHCTTYKVESQAVAAQIFIFQNDRGKKLTQLEIRKAEFMLAAHLYGGEKAEEVISEIKDKFEIIYKSISKIDGRIDEDEVLKFTTQVYYWDLQAKNDWIDLASKEPKDKITFIQEFVQELSEVFKNITIFFNEKAKLEYSYEAYSLAVLWRRKDANKVLFPILLRAYKLQKELKLKDEDFRKLYKIIQICTMRIYYFHGRSVPSDLSSRLNDPYSWIHEDYKDQKVNAVNCLIADIAHNLLYSNEYFEKERFKGYLEERGIKKEKEKKEKYRKFKYILWYYENLLRVENGKSRKEYNNDLEIEHISPQTLTSSKSQEEGKGGKKVKGRKKEKEIEQPQGRESYDFYDKEFLENKLHSLGNLILISSSKRNILLSNKPFKEKCEAYTGNYQQKEVRTTEFLEKSNGHLIWKKKQIDKRFEHIVKKVIDSQEVLTEETLENWADLEDDYSDVKIREDF